MCEIWGECGRCLTPQLWGRQGSHQVCTTEHGRYRKQGTEWHKGGNHLFLWEVKADFLEEVALELSLQG